jgi:tRNA dimethylallyltransferase
LNRDRTELYERINRRVERMIREDGVLEEAKQVLGLPLSHTVRQVHGLGFLEAYLKGERTLADTICLWQQQVRHYARRQLVWFRAEPRIQWLALQDGDSAQAVAERIVERLEVAARQCAA